MKTFKLNALFVLALMAVVASAIGCGTGAITGPDRIEGPSVVNPSIPGDVPVELPTRVDGPTVGTPRTPVTPAAARVSR